MIEVKELSFSYGNAKILDRLTFTAEAGQLLAVLGPNGAGKSTLFRCIFGFLKNYTGEIRIDGREIRGMSRKELARKAAYIPQAAEPVYDYTVLDTVLMGLTGSLNPLQSPGEREYARAEEVLRSLGIEGLKNRGINHISGGERQLVLVARAIAQDARILIMDEPTANLDYGNQYRTLGRVRELAGQGYTVLLSTHNPDHALHFATNILALQRGGAYTTGPAAEQLNEKLIAEIYGIPAEIGTVETALGPVRTCVPVI